MNLLTLVLSTLNFCTLAGRGCRIRGNQGRRLSLGGACAIAFITSGCNANPQVYETTQQWLRWHPALRKSQERNVPFEFEVTPVGDQGLYELKGTTELPEGSQLAIAALRYLKLDPDIVSSSLVLDEDPLDDPFASEQLEDGPPKNSLNIREISTASSRLESRELEASGLETDELSDDNKEQQAAARSLRKRRLALKPSYAILDYQPVTVRDGQWQTQLNLWQVAKDGRYQESWQLHETELNIEWDAEPEVIFLSTLLIDGAADRLQALQNQLAERQLTLNRSLIQTSIWGEQYFQSTQLLEIALPQARTTPPPLQVQDINGGWGRRYLLVEQDPLPGTLAFPEQRNSNGPGSPKEFIQ